MRSKFVLSIVLLLVAQVSELAAEPFEPFQHEFKMTMSGFRASAVRSLLHRDDGNYEFRLRARNMVARYEEKSVFQLDGDGQIVPLEHSVNSRIFGVSRSEKTLFDWEGKLATYTKKDTVRTINIEPGLLDRALYQLLIPRDLSTELKQVSYDFVERGRIKNYTFGVLAEERVELEDTEVNAVKMTRIDDDEEKQTLIWFAPEHNYELVKISHTDEDGSDYHLVLKGEL